MRVWFAFFCLLAPLALISCSWHRKPVSESRIILQGQPNPSFREAPERAGEIIRESNQPRRIY